METKDNRITKLVIAGLVMIVCLSYIFSNRYIETNTRVIFDTWKKEYLILSGDKIIKVSRIEKAPEPKPKLYDSESTTTTIY